MSKQIKAGDEFPASEITDDLIGAEVKFPYRGAAVVGELADSRQEGERSVLYFGTFSSGFVIPESQVVTVVSPPPVKVIQPEEPTARGTLVRIEGVGGWEAVLVDEIDSLPFLVRGPGPLEWDNWYGIIELAAGRQIILSSAPKFPDAEPPETIAEWPEDDAELRGWSQPATSHYLPMTRVGLA